MSKVIGFTWTVEDENLITYHAIYGDTLVRLGRADPRIVVVTADLGNTTRIERFKRAFPERFFNVGVAEQNMTAVAAGLAASGLIPVISSYAVFASLRAAEFVRADLAYNRRNVTVLGTLAGVSFGQGGPTHHAIEDMALMRAIPSMVVMAPCDGHQTGWALEAALAHDGPVYIRIGRSMEPLVYGEPERQFALGRASLVFGQRAGSGVADRVTVIACGVAVYHALSAAERARERGVGVRVLDMHTIKPLDQQAVRAAMVETEAIITAEDHNIVGGLGSAVAEVMAESSAELGAPARLRRLGHRDRFSPMGIPEDLVHQAGFDDDGILQAILQVVDTTSASGGGDA